MTQPTSPIFENVIPVDPNFGYMDSATVQRLQVTLFLPDGTTFRVPQGYAIAWGKEKDKCVSN